MIVMKFGGTSVKDAEAVRRLAGSSAREQRGRAGGRGLRAVEA